ncbi:MAG TPA: energy transducer TonB [Pyrinomonadaceae bacterium]|jgi:TonB family protein|nr:energy transducer TonB [Pyrinomonadaceae bacterium]
MKTSARLRFACVVTLALLVPSSAFVISAAAAWTTTTSAQNAGTSARRKKTARKRGTRRRVLVKEHTKEALPVAKGVGVTSDSPPVTVGVDEPPPPPKPQPTPKSVIVSGGVLNGKAISKPQPAYPPIAKAARAEGVVTVQILVDESGRVISAAAVSGHPLLQQAAVAAARQARFSPTLLSGQPVKVSGVITYNFVLQ